MQVREFIDGMDVAQALLVRDVEVRSRRDGGEYLKLTLGDRTGTVPAMVWEEIVQARASCLPGEVVFITGRYSVHARFGAQIQVQSVRPAHEHEYVRDQLVDGPARTAEQMEADLRELIATVQTRHLRRLLSAIFGEASPSSM